MDNLAYLYAAGAYLGSNDINPGQTPDINWAEFFDSLDEPDSEPSEPDTQTDTQQTLPNS